MNNSTSYTLCMAACLEVEAHCEMKEIEEMLLLFGSDTPSVSPAVDSHNTRFLCMLHPWYTPCICTEIEVLLY